MSRNHSDTQISNDNAARKERVALLSILASAAIAIGKFVAGILSGSLALISEAAHALVDTGATIITYFAVRTANKPADEEHHYGHGKFESLAALAETVILFILATVVIMHAYDRLMQGGGEFEPTILAFCVLIVSIIIDINRVYTLRKVARETGSQALAADALHFASDLAGSTLVLLGLVAALFGFKYGDALAAIGVALFVAIAGWRLGRSTIDTLLDTAPKGMAERVRAIVNDVPGVVEVAGVRLRPGGTGNFGEIAVAISRTLPLERVVAIKERITKAVREEFADTTLTVTTEPRALDDETVLDRVLIAAAKRRLLVHHITVQDVENRLSISLDLEVDGRLSLGAAHIEATRLEIAIRDELGPETEVETHIEPLEVSHLSGLDVPQSEASEVSSILEATAAKIPAIESIHDVRVRRTPAGLVVNYHCYFDDALDVATMHKNVDLLERRFRRQYPGVVRVVGHAEPRLATILSQES